MAKLRAPIFSFGASGKLGDALVFFGWKGLDVVRSYVVPANPRTARQTTQRGYLTDMVAKIHTAQASLTHPLTALDTSAYALWASALGQPWTWFNMAVKNGVDQLVASLREAIYSSGVVTPGTDELAVSIWTLGIAPTAGVFRYGTSRTALINSATATCVAGQASATISNLTTGVKYFIQFVPSAPATLVGTKSGIYTGYPD